jgi:sugar phosphate isomerase/epimerase
VTGVETIAAATAVRVHPRLSLNQATVKYATLPEALAVTADAGIAAIGLWREPVAGVGLDEAVRMLADSGLRFSSLCRGGFVTALPGRSRDEALADNLAAIDETAALAAAGAPGSAPVLVLVPGGLPPGDRDLPGARARVVDAIGRLAGPAQAAGVVLAVEPMHPMYAADRGVISTLGQALDAADQFPPEVVGVVVDTFHVWWDPDLEQQIARAGAGGRIAAYQVCDWVTPLAADVLLARGMIGEGHIDLAAVTRAVAGAGYGGDVEVEIFNQRLWDSPYADVAARIVERFAAIGLPAEP